MVGWVLINNFTVLILQSDFQNTETWLFYIVNLKVDFREKKCALYTGKYGTLFLDGVVLHPENFLLPRGGEFIDLSHPRLFAFNLYPLPPQNVY